MHEGIKRVFYIFVLITLVTQPSYVEAKLHKELRRWMLDLSLRCKKLMELQSEEQESAPSRLKASSQSPYHKISPSFYIKCTGVIAFTMIFIIVGKKKIALNSAQNINPIQPNSNSTSPDQNNDIKKIENEDHILQSNHGDQGDETGSERVTQQPPIPLDQPSIVASPVIAAIPAVVQEPEVVKQEQTGAKDKQEIVPVDENKPLLASPKKITEKMKAGIQELATDVDKTAGQVKRKIQSSKPVQSFMGLFKKKS